MNKKGGMLGYRIIMGAISGALIGGILTVMYNFSPAAPIGGSIAGMIIGGVIGFFGGENF